MEKNLKKNKTDKILRKTVFIAELTFCIFKTNI